jgi:hypothetical protein
VAARPRNEASVRRMAALAVARRRNALGQEYVGVGAGAQERGRTSDAGCRGGASSAGTRVRTLERHSKTGAHESGSGAEGAAATAVGLTAATHGRCKQDATRTKERARLRRARMKLKCSSSERTRTEGSEAAHDGSLARAAADGPATRQGRNREQVRHQAE